MSNVPSYERVLVVDDDADLLSLVTAFLGALNYPTVAAGSAEEALAFLYVCAERIDLVLTDYQMPGMNGIELARLIAQLKPTLPVLCMSGLHSIAEAFNDEGLSYLLKPFGIDELQNAIETCLTKSRLRKEA